MTINTPSEALAVARATKVNKVGFCQMYVTGYYNALAAGDFDGDGAADAEDGWKKEPGSARHTDRQGRVGYPAAFLGGSHDNGHRAIFCGPGRVRSTDFSSVTKRYTPGVVGEGTVAEVEAAMGVTYVGWSETINGQEIPHDVRTRGEAVDEAIRKLRRAEKRSKEGSLRQGRINRALDILRRIPLHIKRTPN